MNSFSKIIQILNLASTGQREETHRDIVIYILYLLDEECSKSQIMDFISDEIGIKLIEDEVDIAISSLEYDGKIKKLPTGYQLSSDTKENCIKHEKDLKGQEDNLLADFKLIIESISDEKLNFNILYEAYKEFLIEWVYLFGNETLRYFLDTDDKDFTQKIDFPKVCLPLKQKPKELKVFNGFIKEFPFNLSDEQINYISKLCDKSESFFSLGLPKDLVQELSGEGFLNWVIYLDTNVLYSILKLRYHQHNELCDKLVEIINDKSNRVNIKLKYFTRTRDELLAKKDFFETTIPKRNYTESQIRSALKSESLDSFSEMYLKSILEHKSSAPHPVDILKNLTRTLKSKGIEINRKDIQVQPEDEHFKDMISEYHKYEELRNEARQDKGLDFREPKSLDKLDHDLFFRENIKLFRVRKPATLNEAKFFGLSLDNMLISFDKYMRKKEPMTSDHPIPTIFYPQFLLFKLLRFLPLDASDHKEAFLKMLRMPTVRDTGDSKKSQKVMRTVAKFNALGINNEDFIVECVTDEIFIESIGSEEELTEVDVSKIDRKYDERLSSLEKELDKLKESLEKEQREKEHVITGSFQKEQKISGQKSKIEELTELVRVYQGEIKKIRKPKNSEVSPSAGVQLNIDTQENIINYDVLAKRFKKWNANIRSMITNVLIGISSANVLFALLLMILAIFDKALFEYYWMQIGLIGLIYAYEKIVSETVNIMSLLTSPMNILLFVIYGLTLVANYQDIMINTCLIFDKVLVFFT